MSRKYEWTPHMLTELRHAWRDKPADQSAKAFDEAFCADLSCSWRTVERARGRLRLRTPKRGRR